MSEEQKKEKAELPFMRFFDDWYGRYQRSWNRNRDALNSFYEDVTNQDAKASSWTTGMSNLWHAYSESAGELYGGWMGFSGKYGSSRDGYARLLFLIDPSADSTDTQEVYISSSVDRAKIKTTLLRRTSDDATFEPVPPAPPLPRNLNVDTSGTGCIKVAVAGLKPILPALKKGVYTAVIYEDTQPPPAKPLACVEVRFL